MGKTTTITILLQRRGIESEDNDAAVDNRLTGTASHGMYHERSTGRSNARAHHRQNDETKYSQDYLGVERRQ